MVGQIVESKIVEESRRRSLYECLVDGHRTGVRVIAEIKPASTIEGHLQSVDLTLTRLLKSFENGGASAISVLIEPNYFGGSLDLLTSARAQTELPLLAKGFVFRPIHVAQCAAAGADAFLLMVRVVESTGARLHELLTLGRSLGMCAVVEANSPEEIFTAVSAGAEIIAVNSRNIYTDLSTDLRNISMARDLPDELVLIAASGIRKAYDIQRVFEFSEGRVDAVLVGTALMQSEDCAGALCELVDAGQRVVRKDGGGLRRRGYRSVG